MDRAARGRGLQDRPAAPDLHRADRDRLHAGGRALNASTDGSGRLVWIDGRLTTSPGRPTDRSQTDDSSGCYTTARIRVGRATFAERHVARLQRDARSLGLPAPPAARILEAIEVLGQAVFGAGEGIVRVEVRAGGNGASSLAAIPRPYAPGPAAWRAVVARFAHPGPAAALGAKLLDRPAWHRGRALAADAGVDETLLFDGSFDGSDGSGCLVEGARSNLLVVGQDGRLRETEPALGAVAGLGVSVLRDAGVAMLPGRLERAALASAVEVIAVNAVRGVRSIVEIDGEPVGDGNPGPVARRLSALFETALQLESRSDR